MSAGSAVAAPGDLDRSFGENGVVELNEAPAPGGERAEVVGVAAGPGNDSFTLNSSWQCSRDACVTSLFVAHRLADGSLDASYGSTPLGVPVFSGLPGLVRTASITVDDEDRPVVAATVGGMIQLVRLDSRGELDRSFGMEGLTTTSCGCNVGDLRVAIDPQGRLVILAEWEAIGPELGLQPGLHGWQMLLTRFLPDGSLDRSFGNFGTVVAPLPTSANPAARAERVFSFEPDGTMAFVRGTCCSDVEAPRFEHVLGTGEIERRLDVTGAKTPPPLGLTALLPRSNGTLDLIGKSEGRGFLLRLRADGAPARGFGHGGFRLIKPRLEAAVLDRRGRILGAEDRPRSFVVYRRLADGRADRTFAGGGGAEVTSGEFGQPQGLFVQRNQRLLIFGLAGQGCRQYCPPIAHLARIWGGDSGARCMGHKATIVGTRQGDTLTGTPHRDVIAGLGGDDAINGGGGDDLICGGPGHDTIVGGPGRDRIRQ